MSGAKRRRDFFENGLFVVFLKMLSLDRLKTAYKAYLPLYNNLMSVRWRYIKYGDNQTSVYPASD